MDQRLEDDFVDLAQSHYTQAGAKGVQDANVGCAMAMAQAGKSTPSALFGQEAHQQIERMHRSQQCQQMRAPKLSGTELPARTTNRTCVPALVDEVVWNIWVQQVKQLAGTGHRKAAHWRQSLPLLKRFVRLSSQLTVFSPMNLESSRLCKNM